jgi:hypothetical protein
MGVVATCKEELEIIVFFENQLTKRKSLLDKALWLADLKDIYESLMPYLSVSELTKEHIHQIIIDAQKKEY